MVNEYCNGFTFMVILIFFCKRNIKRFLPASVLVIFLEALNVQFGKKTKIVGFL